MTKTKETSVITHNRVGGATGGSNDPVLVSVLAVGHRQEDNGNDNGGLKSGRWAGSNNEIAQRGES